MNQIHNILEYEKNDRVISSFSWSGNYYQVVEVNDYEIFDQVCKLRYQSYVNDRACKIDTANHVLKGIFELEDLFANVFAVIKNRNEVIATARSLYTPMPKTVVDHMSPLYEFTLLEHIHKNNFVILGYVVVKDSYQKQGPFLYYLLESVYRHVISRGFAFMYANANNHLLRLWRRFGWREYKNQEISKEFGEVTPLYLDLLDIEHFKHVRSPLLSVALSWKNRLDSNIKEDNPLVY